ncbi:MAG: LysM peptidoglycan-binding domain-containing protein [Casimicrobiaceae bacterium]
MLQQFTTGKRFTLVLAAAALLAGAPSAVAQAPQSPQLADRAPQTYTVVRGDTLWGISGKFLKDPWRWPEVWRMNRDEIKNPHLIYPGDQIRLVMVDGQPTLQLSRNADTIIVTPTTRVTQLNADAIPSIPPGDIEPFLTKPLITGRGGLDNAAQILRGRNEERVVRGTGDVVYVLGIDQKAGDFWYIYRPVGAVLNIDSSEVLGYENRFLGTARVEKFGDLSTVRIESAVQEIQIGDRLIPAPREVLVNYVPRAPDKPVNARILRVPFDNIETGRGGIVTLDKGTADGIEPGHVLAVYRVIPPIVDPRPSSQQTVILRFLDPTTVFTPREFVQPADERTGLVFVFRTFDRVSFGLVINSTDPVRPGDWARKP